MNDIRKEDLTRLKIIASDICEKYEKFTNTNDPQLNARAYGCIDTAHNMVDMFEKWFLEQDTI